MKILAISYDSFVYDGRIRELISAMKELGEVIYITRATEGETEQEASHILYRGRGYSNFILFVCQQMQKVGRQDVILIDNRKGIIPGYLAKKLAGAKYVVQDCRELYSMKSAAGIPGKIGCFVEKIFTRRSDVVIAANVFRAKAMVKMFRLKDTPLSYENVHRLEYTSEEKFNQIEEECREFFKEEKFRIVSTSGCDISRLTGDIVRAMKGLGSRYELLLIGESSEKDENAVRAMIRGLGLTNVKILPRMDHDHLKYFIDNCQVGMVTYHQRDLNNKYCASGKIYEFLFEGKPIVTSTNPPLKEFCRKYKVGQATDNFEEGIRSISDNYGRWTDAAQRFCRQDHVENSNLVLAEQIRKRLEER